MSRRTRAVVFLALALVTAALAAGIADSYGSRVASGYGPLRPVVIVAKGLEADEVLDPEDIDEDLELHRIPTRFVPVGALRDPREALGLAPTIELDSGSYLIAGQLQPPESASRRMAPLGKERRPVEISVSGAEALLATGRAEADARVDVVITTEPSASGIGRTYVAAAAVPLLALGPGADGPAGTAAATLALTKAQALRLIAAESFARKLTLLPEG